MLKISIELVSAITGRVSEIGRMYIANDGHGTAERGDYIAAVCRRGTEEVPRELWLWPDHNPEAPAIKALPKATRSAKIKDYPRQAYNVWRLITRCALACFPEERTQRALKSGAPQLDESVMRGLSYLRDKADDNVRVAHLSTSAWEALQEDAEHAREWLDASKADHT